MAIFASYKLPLLAAGALVATTAAIAQETGTRITVVGAMQETGTRITVVGAMQETGTRITVVGAAKDRAGAQPAENPADSAVPELPVVYEDSAAAQTSAPAPANGGDTGNGKAAPAATPIR